MNSGGSLRELMRLIQEACLETMGDKIDAAAADKAIVNVRAELTHPMPQTYFAELAKIHQGKQTDNTADQRSILFYRYALEYKGLKPFRASRQHGLWRIARGGRPQL